MDSNAEVKDRSLTVSLGVRACPRVLSGLVFARSHSLRTKIIFAFLRPAIISCFCAGRDLTDGLEALRLEALAVCEGNFLGGRNA
jgi:hypothetical protein